VEWQPAALVSAGGTAARLGDIQSSKQGKAALAWLNLQATFEPKIPTSPAVTLGPFLDYLGKHLTLAGISIVHLKMIVSSRSGFVKAAIGEDGQEPRIEGTLHPSLAAKHEILLNLRAIGEPQNT
jgi:hypothetical protein